MQRIIKTIFILNLIFFSTSLKAVKEEWEDSLTSNQKLLNVGEKFPEIEYYTWENNEVKIGKTANKKSNNINTEAMYIIVPGAFTPTCTGVHINKFVEEYNNKESFFCKKGIRAYVVASNTPDVVAAWAYSLGLQQNDLLEFIGDPHRTLLKQLGVMENNDRLSVIGRRSIFYVNEGKVIGYDSETSNAEVCKTASSTAENFWKDYYKKKEEKLIENDANVKKLRYEESQTSH